MQAIQVKQILFLIFLLFAFLIIFGFLIYSSTANSAVMNEESPPTKRKLIQYENSDINIDPDEIIDGDIVIQGGSITIAGEIHGHIITLNANVYLEPKASISGHLVKYQGEMVRDEGSRIGGDVVSISDGEISISKGREIPGFDIQLNTYKNDAIIEKDQTIYGDILVLKSQITIDGKVDGCVINISGVTKVSRTAAIDGNVISYDGRLVVEGDALITGRTLSLYSESKVSHKEEPEEEEKDQEIQKEVERKYLKRDHERKADIVRFLGNVTIESDEFIRGDVVTLRGTIKVQGEVDGDVVAVFGNVELDSTAQVNGDVVSVGGKIYRDKGSFVGGDLVQTTITGVKVDDGNQHVSVGVTGISIGPKKGDEWERNKCKGKGHWSHDFDEETFMFRYNRVEGLFLGLRLTRDDWRENSWFDLYGHAGYGFSRKHGCFQIGLERSFFGRYGPVIGAEAHDIVYSEDDWIIPTFENSLAALFLREDFQDYYRKEGYSAYLCHDISEYLTLTGEFRKDHHYNLRKKTNKSIFGGDKKFHDNPLIDEIDFKSVAAKVTFDTRNHNKYPDQGWFINLIGEFAGPDFNKNGVDFDRFIVDIRRYQPITYGENLDFRLRAGSSRGILPDQLRFDLGGLSTIRGYKFKEFENHNRMLLGNIEYRIHGRRNPLNAMGMSDFGIFLFADAGYAWSIEDSDTLEAKDGFEQIDWADLYTSIGCGISNREGNVRLECAKRLDEKDLPLVVTFRINRPF